MTAKQSIITGGVLAALLVSGPIVWRANQIQKAEQSLAKMPTSPAPGNLAESTSKPSGLTAESPTGPDKTRSGRDRSATALSEADRERMMGAIPQIAIANIQQSMTEWFAQDSWMEANRTARALGLSAEVEKELKELFIAEHARMIESMGAADPADKLTKSRERDARVDAWFATKLTPDQQQSRKRMDDARTASLTAELATSAVQGISANLDLTEGQQTKLHEVAAEKVTRELKEKPHARSFGLGFVVRFATPSLPVEEEAQDLVGGILDPAQMELWKVAIQRDRSFGETFQKRVIGNVFDQLAKIKPTQEELQKPFEN